MKFSILPIMALAITAAAQPHHQHQHPAKRQNVAVDTVVDVVTATDFAAVVFVDPNGQPISTSFEAPTASPVVQLSSASYTPAAPTSSLAGIGDPPPAPEPPAPSASSLSQPQATSEPSSAAPTGSGTGSVSDFGYGISYSPYNNDGSCKSQDQVNADLDVFSDYGMVRIYGTDCNQVSTVLSAAQAKGVKIFAGIFDITQAAAEAQTLIDAAQGNWDAIHTVSVGNEAVSNGTAPSAVVSALNTVRGMLQASGYSGSVVTVETYTTLLNNLELCQASDYAAANCHAFFDADVTAAQAGEYVLGQANLLAQRCGKNAVITESGWPSEGDTNGLAVPSLEDQRTAIDSLKSSFSNNIVLFSAFNDYWKQNTPSTFNAEQYWGIYGNAPA